MSSTGKTRLQLTNGYPVNFDQLARLLHFVYQDERTSVPLTEIAMAVGVSDVHAEFLSRVANVLGIVTMKVRKPTALGLLTVTRDTFFDDIGTLWIMHYTAASNPQNLVWNRLVNGLVPEQRYFTVDDFRGQFGDIKEQFTKNSFSAYVNKETRSLLDAYTVQKFARLEYLHHEGEEGYRLAYREPLPPLVLAACIARYRDQHRPNDNSLSVSDLLNAPNGPGVVCQIPEDRLRSALEYLKTQPGISLESRADLDQIRLTDNTQDYQWMERYYASRH